MTLRVASSGFDARPGTRVLLEDIVGSRVLTADGRQIGRVVDLEAVVERDFVVESLVVGTSGWLHRLHVAWPLRRHMSAARVRHVVPWSAVSRYDGLVVLLSEGIDEAELVPVSERVPTHAKTTPSG